MSASPKHNDCCSVPETAALDLCYTPAVWLVFGYIYVNLYGHFDKLDNDDMGSNARKHFAFNKINGQIVDEGRKGEDNEQNKINSTS